MYVWLPNDQTGDDESVLTVSVGFSIVCFTSPDGRSSTSAPTVHELRCDPSTRFYSLLSLRYTSVNEGEHCVL